MEHLKAINIPKEVSARGQFQKQAFLGKGKIDGISNIGRAIFEPGQEAPAHQHEEREVFVFESGDGAIITEKGVFDVSEGDIVIVDSMEKHGVRNRGDKDLAVLYFELNSVSPRGIEPLSRP